MKAASSSEWYDTTPRLPYLHHHHPSTSSFSSSTSLPRLHPPPHHHQHKRGLFRGDSSSLRHESSSHTLTSDYSFSSSTGTSGTDFTSSHHPPRLRTPQRQLSKVVTPTITPTTSTSFSKSYSRSSRSLSNSNSTETATSTSKTTTEETSTEYSNRPPYSFSPDAKKFIPHLSSYGLQKSISSNNRTFSESSRGSGKGRNGVASKHSTSFPPVIIESEASEETDVAFTEEEEPGGTEDCYDDEEEEEDQVYQSFKQSVRMLGVPSFSRNQRSSRSESPAVSLQSVVTDLEEDEEDLPPEHVEDGATSYTEEDEATTSSYRSSEATIESMRSFTRSRSVPKTPMKVRVKVEKAVPQMYFDDRVKVTVQVEDEETEGPDYSDYEEGEEEEDEDEEEEEEDDDDDDEEGEEENSGTESDATSTNTAETVRYLRRDGINDIIEEVNSSEESASGESDQSESEPFSQTSGEDEVMSSIDKTDYLPTRTPLFPPISGIHRREPSPKYDSMSNMLRSRPAAVGRNLPIYDTSQHTIESSSRSGEASNLKRFGTYSIESTGVSESISSEFNNLKSSGDTATASSSTVTASNSDLSSRSQSARSSLTGRASSIHKMYSVGGKVRSLSARRSPTRQLRLLASSHPSQLQRLQQPSTDSMSQSSDKTSSGSTSESKQSLPDAHLGTLTAPSILPHSRSLSATSSSKRRFSATLRQLSLGNIQAMNLPFPKPASHVLAEKVFKGESLPPISPSSASSSSNQSSTSKPRPLTRNLTYTVCTHSTEESDATTSSNGMPTLPPPKSTEHITLRQLIMDDRTSSASTKDSEKSGSQQSLHELLFPAGMVKKEEKEASPSTGKQPAQVSFATNVIEHSLSTSHTLESTSSEQTGSTQRTDSTEEESSDSSYVYCRLTGRRVKRLTAEQEDELLNKDYLTFQDLQQESLDEPDTSQERLRHFALDTIRKQMAMERRRIESMTEQEDEIFIGDYYFSEGEESGSTENSSEEEEDEEEDEEDEEDEETPKPKAWEEASHIPVATSNALLPETGTGAEISADIAEASADKVVEHVLEKVPSQEKVIEQLGENLDQIVDGDKPLLAEDDDKEEEIISLLPTRINSAESGYRAMPPSRAGSSRENSLDPEELEKEKERLMQQWKDSGGTGAPPAITTSMNSSSSQVLYGGELITINYSRPNTASDANGNSALIQNGIDLTQELPGEEKKIAAVWEEFNRDEREGGAMADYEFSTLLDEMVSDVNNYKPKLSTTGLSNENSSQSHSLQVSSQVTSTSWEQPKFDPTRKYTSLSELISLLSHNLRLVSSETLEDHMASLISLISSVLRKVRKNKTEDDYTTQIACLSAIRVLCDRLQEMTSSQNLKYADLSWLFRVLCKYSSDSESKIRREASFCLARLVRVAGPALVVRPIYFILVMESEGGSGKSTTGSKTKAAAIDTLTYAMLTFPKEDFHNLEEIAGWVCLAMLNEERRIRQSALECLAIISQHLGGRDKALPLFHTLFLKEELDHFSRSPSPESHKTSKTGKSSKRGGKGSDPIPLSVHGTVRLLTGPGFPIAQPIDAITARLDKDILPVPSTKGLIEYAVNVPTGKDLVLLMTHMLDKDDDEWDFSSSTDSMDSGSAHSKRSSVTSLGFSDIDWTGEGPDKTKNKEDEDLISPDVAYILLGKGRVNKSDVVLLDTYKKEIIPEIIQMLNEKNKQGKGRRNRRRWSKNMQNKKKRRRKRGSQRRKGGRLIPTVSLDAEDDTFPPNDDDDDDGGDGGPHEESVDPYDGEPDSPVAVVVDPPPDDPSKSTGTEDGTPKTDT